MKNCVNCWEPAKDRYYNVVGNDRRDSLKNSIYVAISSQATWRQVEGSTTNVDFLPDLGYTIPFYGAENETTRVRNYQNLFGLFRRIAGNDVLQEQQEMQRLYKNKPFKVESGEPRKTEGSEDTGIRKRRRQVQSIFTRVPKSLSGENEGSREKVGRSQSRLYSREAEGKICFGRGISQSIEVAQFSEAQEIENKYAEMGYQRHTTSNIFRSHYENGRYWNTTSCRPYIAIKGRKFFWLNCSVEFKGSSLYRKLQKERQIGRRYSLDLDRKAKKQYLNDIAITHRNRIWDISKIPLPFTDMIGTDTSTHPYKEWTTDELAAPDTTNARVDGADAGSMNNVLGQRVGNHHQISDKVVKVSFRADASNTIGRAKELSYQLSRRQQELRRDVEAIMLLNQASVADDGNATPGKSAGLPAWIKTNVQLTGAQAVGGFQTGTGLVSAFTRAAAAVGLTETKVRVAAQQVYQNGGEASVFMTTPDVVQAFSSYLFTSSARVATLMSDVEGSAAKATAMGSVNVFVTDFGTLKFVPNRLQPKFTIAAVTNAADVFILDPSYLSISYLQGYRTEELAKTGSANNRQILVDWTLCVGNEKAQAMLNDINPATAVVA